MKVITEFGYYMLKNFGLTLLNWAILPFKYSESATEIEQAKIEIWLIIFNTHN